ncbi:flagellar hook protein FlgE [Geodermatophilus sabuli]|nr:flagellar hook protein FlgE [Geodermatophilus sabuli]
MFSAISGLKAHQTKMDVTGNNIANVNTVGYKSQSTVFEAALSQMMRAGGAPAEGTAGSNPAQVGLGVKVAGISTNWAQGATQTTGRATDFMIEGDGFFVVQSGTQQLFTRSGSFGFDSAGNMITDSGAILQGWSADANGVVDANGRIGNLSIPFGQGTAPKATGTGAIDGNLSAGTEVGKKAESSITMYDNLGNEVPVTFVFEKTATGWNVKASKPDPADPTATLPLNGATGQDITFDAAGALATPASGELTLTGVSTTAVTIDISTVTQYGSPTTAAAAKQDGYSAGVLESFSLGNDGMITGVFSNDQTKVLGQLALATFANPGGLEKAGSSTYRPATNSGLALIGQAATGGRGALNAGALEMSNVDLAEEFTGLIVAQRGFQANSRVITSSDEILQDLVNLKR